MAFTWSRIRESLSERTRRWAYRRHGRDPARLVLASGRIYIVPTPSGLVFGAMIATMLAGSMNYNNNLAFALTFLLAGIGIATIDHTHRTLAGLRLGYVGAEPVFAGDPLDVRLDLANESSNPREEIFLDWPGATDVAGGVASNAVRSVHLPLRTERRGLVELPGLRLSTCAPLGLMRAWAWVHLDASPVVYPRPAPSAQPARRREAQDPGAGPLRAGDDDFAGLRDYRTGDSPRRIAWRSYARTGSLLVRDYRGGEADDPLWIDWADVDADDIELRVSRLTRLVIDAFESGRLWGLGLPGTRIEPAQGRDHLHRCLHALAMIGAPA
jgi:uncharacterized protein (DUF58 family)